MTDNILIAKFMGGVMTTPDPKCKHISFIRGSNPISPTKKQYYTISQLKYHKKWDWIMPVTDRIESLGYSYDRVDADVFINSQSLGECVIPNPMSENGWTMLDKTYVLVVEFVKYYNKLGL